MTFTQHLGACVECGTTRGEIRADGDGRPVCADCTMGVPSAPPLGGGTGAPPEVPRVPRVGTRYANRVLNVGQLLAAPDEPLPWRCDRLAADGYLTVLAGAGGQGKSWLTLALAIGVARGQPVAEFDCVKGRAVIFDAENGEKLIGRRLRAACVTPDLAVQPIESGGLRFIDPADMEWFKSVIREQRANLVVFDSLRVLASGVKESDGDAMEPVITGLKLLARETGAAIILVHHRGKSEEGPAYRGSSVILDQTDMLFALGRVVEDPEARTRRKLVTAKCRIDEEPEPRWFSIDADRSRGLVFVEEAEPFDGSGEGAAGQLLAALPDTPTRWSDWARDAGFANPKQGNLRRAREQMADDLKVKQVLNDLWVRPDWEPPAS